MTDKIEVNKFTRSRRRTIALIVERDGTLTVRAPMRASQVLIQQFIREKADWIARTSARLSSIVESPARCYADGETFLYLGSTLTLKLVKPQRPALQFKDGFTLSQTSQKRGEALFTRWYKEQALEVISARVTHYSQTYGYASARIRISSAKARWGSCSPNGSLNFTWRLVMAPLEVIDYVVLHELTHLKVKNHSRKFWRAVEIVCPEYKKQRKWLREHGEKLTL